MINLEGLTHVALDYHSKKEFLLTSNLTRAEIPNTIHKMISWAFTKRHSEALKSGLFMCYIFDIYPDSISDMLSQIILQDWHKYHKDISTVLLELMKEV